MEQMKIFIRILACFIPVKSWRKKFRAKYSADSDRHRCKVVVSKLKRKIKSKQKIRVCFSVIYDSVFQARPIFEKMLKDDMFEPFILVIPDNLRGNEHMFAQMEKTYNALISQYKQVYNSYDYNEKSFTDYSDKADIIFFANPYDAMTKELYKIEYAFKKGILCFYTSYGYVVSNWHYSLYSNKEFSSLHRIYALEKFEYDKLRENLANPKAACLAGYCKMDSLAKLKERPRDRKKIIIAPHHSVMKEGIGFSTFLKYCDFFLELPKKYPNIDFVFRPHPLLFTNLENSNIWDGKKIQKYIEDMKANPNVEYQEGGDYFDTFVNSDGLIHDCGSFIAEYLFTPHPCCFLAKKETKSVDSNEFHKNCIEQHYKAFEKEDIISFIENVVLNNSDDMKEQRKEFFGTVLKNNYPNTTDFIYNDIKKELRLD